MAELEFHVGDVHGHDVAALSGHGGLAERGVQGGHRDEVDTGGPG